MKKKKNPQNLYPKQHKKGADLLEIKLKSAYHRGDAAL